MTLAVVLPVVDHVMSDTVGLPLPPLSNVMINDRPEHHHHRHDNNNNNNHRHDNHHHNNNNNHHDDDDDPDHHDWFLLHSTKNMCRACRSITSIRIDWSQGDRICTACGVVQEERICDRNPEWRDYGDRDDHNNNDSNNGGCHRARSGMIPTDESKYIGGLQPTTLSRSVYQGSNGVRKVSNSSSSSSFTPNIVQRLRKVHRKIENGIQNKSKLAMKEATWNLQSLKKRHNNLERRPRDTTITSGDADTEQTDTVTATLEDPNDDDDDDDLPDYGSHVEWTEERVGTTRITTTTSKKISDYEHLVQEQERLVLQQRQALYASKWSLDRAKLLFESRMTTHSHHHLDQSIEEIEKDPVLYQAAQDLFAGYTMICHACTKLHLSMAVTDEAAALLSQYAARRDGLKVRGIATTTNISNTVITTSSSATNHHKHNALMIAKRWGRPNQPNRTITNHSNHQPSSSHKDKTEFELQEEKQTIRQMNQVRQMASLCAGIIFWIARYRNKPRTIMAVCDSMDDKVSKKMLSRALQELKQIVPELARFPAATTTTTPSSLFSLQPPTPLSNTTVPAAISVQQNHHHHQQHHHHHHHQQRSTVSNHSSNIDVSAIESIVNIIEHALQKLHLPPVAEASVRYLVLQPCFSSSNDSDIAPTTTLPPHQFHHAATLAKNVPVQCAALTYLVTMVGRTMQQLAKQAHDTDRQKHNRNHTNKRLANISHSDTENKKIKRTMPPQDDDTDEAQLSDNLMSFDLFADNVPMDESAPDSFNMAGQHAQISTPTSSSSSSSMVLAEHRAYEMRRMWDAWSEQLPWDRSLTQIEQSTKVTSKNVVEYYKQHVYPHRFMLLETLRDSMKDNDSLKGGTPHAMYLAQEGSIMRKTPLSSVLLSNILVAAPLLKNDMKV